MKLFSKGQFSHLMEFHGLHLRLYPITYNYKIKIVDVKDLSYLLGIFIAIAAGVVSNVGMLMQKKAINDLPEEEKKIGKGLFKKPLWLSGIIIGVILAAALFFLANTPQWGVGAALVPGLAASGLIILTIGSIKLLNEEVTKHDVLGILLMIGGIALLGFSELEIKIVDTSIFSNIGFLIRAIVFTLTFVGISISCQILQKTREKYRGILLAVYSGSMFAMQNLWVAFVMGLFGPVFGSGRYLILFAITCIIIIIGNVMGFFKIQQAYLYGEVSKLIPVQNGPMQIGPIFIYFAIFMWAPPKVYSLPFMIGGVILILSSSIFLAKRQAQLEEIK